MRHSGRSWIRGASRSSRRRMAIRTRSSASRPACLVHRLRAARSPLRADAHRRLRDGWHARQPKRPHDRRSAEHRNGQCRTSRSPRTCRRPTSSSSSKCRRPTFDAGFGNTEGGVTNLSIKSGTNELRGTVVLQQDAAKPVRQRLLREREQHSPVGLHLQPVWRIGRRACDVARIRRAAPDLLHVWLRGHPRSAPAQQRHADGSDRSDAQRRFLGAARPREPVSDLQPVHPARDRWRPLSAGSVPRQHHPAGTHQPGREESSRVHREAADRRNRRRHEQLPEPGAAGDNQVRHEHHPRRPRHHKQAAPVCARKLVRPEQQLQQLLQQPLHRRVVQVRLPAGRGRPRVRPQRDPRC